MLALWLLLVPVFLLGGCSASRTPSRTAPDAGATDVSSADAHREDGAGLGGRGPDGGSAGGGGLRAAGGAVGAGGSRAGTGGMTGGGGGGTAAGGAPGSGIGGAPGTGGTGPVAFPLKLSADRRYLTDQNGVPFLIAGDAAWSLIAQLTQADAETYLEDRRSRGFNLLLVNLIEHHFAARAPANAYGDAPFTTPGDFTTPNEAYFARADWILQRAAQKGIAVLLAPAYLGYQGGDEGWYSEMVTAGTTKLRTWGAYVGNRYKAFDNLIWLEGGDFTPPNVGLVNAVADGIKQNDTRHLHAAHWDQETSGTEVTVSGWLDLDSTYTYQPVYLKSLDDYNRDLLSGKPHFLIESAYENERSVTTATVRAESYYTLVTGGIGQIFGNNPIWQFGTGWQTALGSPGSVSMSNLQKLFAPRAWTTLVPDQLNRMLVAGQGTSGSDGYAFLARGNTGRLAIAYLPNSRAVTIDLTMMTGPILARWYDPSNGAFTAIAGSAFAAVRTPIPAPPTRNAAGDPDWVLLLETAP